MPIHLQNTAGFSFWHAHLPFSVGSSHAIATNVTNVWTEVFSFTDNWIAVDFVSCLPFWETLTKKLKLLAVLILLFCWTDYN